MCNRQLIGTNSAVVAVLDIKLVITQDNKNIATNNAKGDAFSPKVPTTVLAIFSPAPVLSKALAKASVPPNKNIVCMSIVL